MLPHFSAAAMSLLYNRSVLSCLVILEVCKYFTCIWVLPVLHAMISKKNAKWLLEYDKSGGEIKLTENDRQRLKAFVGATGEEFGEE